jgi:DNA-binding transcriptional LysR family regulator
VARPPGLGGSRNVRPCPRGGLPLALYCERSVSGDAALAALRNQKVASEIVYTSPSLTGLRAAALAGLAITQFAIYEKPQPNEAVSALAAVLLALAQGPSRPTI